MLTIAILVVYATLALSLLALWLGHLDSREEKARKEFEEKMKAQEVWAPEELEAFGIADNERFIRHLDTELTSGEKDERIDP